MLRAEEQNCHDVITILESVARDGDASSLPWDTLKSCGLLNRTPRSLGPNPICGKMLQYAKQQVSGFRERLGPTACIFKIGVTAHPAVRFQDYVLKHFSQMWIVFKSNDLSLVHMLEAALISEFCTCTGCRNAPHTGGEGALNQKKRGGPPFYVYVTGGRADQAKWVG